MERYEIDKGLNPYERLAAAIVRQAVDDWRDTSFKVSLLRQGGIAWERERCNLYLLERWFLGDWCSMLTYGNGEVLLDMLKRGIDF